MHHATHLWGGKTVAVQPGARVEPVGVAAVLREIASLERWRDVTLIGPCAGGESGGAYLVERGTSERWVLKWSSAPTALRDWQIAAIERLRACGYPIPRHVAVPIEGGTAVLQEFVPGIVGAPVGADLAAEVVRLVRLQAGLAGEPHPDGLTWPDLVVASLTEGLDGWCVHEPLAEHSDRSRALLDRIRATGRRMASVPLPAADLVHLDLHASNVVSEGGRVSAVIDWDGMRTGDRRADLVKFAFTAVETAPEPVLASLWDPLLRSSTDGAVDAYVAHVVLNLVDWNIRFHPDRADVAMTCGERAFGWLDAARFTG